LVQAGAEVMAERSIFFEEWRRCLQEHYRQVIRTQDSVTEKTLVGVLHRVGFSDDELRQLYMEATMRADGTPADFVPDMSKLPFYVHPAECTCAACMDKTLEVGHDAEGQPIIAEPEPEPEAAGNLFAVAKMDDREALTEPEDDIFAVNTGEEAAEDLTEEETGSDEIASEIDKKSDKNKDDKPKQMTMF
jgi:hypothetical protein